MTSRGSNLPVTGSTCSTTPGQVLIREGETNTHLYIVLSGMFNVTTLASGTEVELDSVGPGDCLGEVAIFNPDQASATVKSQNNGQLWTIDVDSLQKFLIDWPNYGCAALLGINIILSRPPQTGQFHHPLPRNRTWLPQRSIPEARRRCEAEVDAKFYLESKRKPGSTM